MLIRNLVTAKRPSTKTSKNSPRPKDVNFLNCLLSVAEFWRFQVGERQELKAQYLYISTNRNADL